MTGRILLTLAIASLGTGCAGPSLAKREQAAQGALEALRGADFEQAGVRAQQVLASDGDNPYAHVVAAINRFRATMQQLVTDVPSAMASIMFRGFNQRYMRFTLEQAERELAQVDRDLAMAARHPAMTLDLCLACWRVDWNRNGQVDSRDERLFEVELDADGRQLPAGDPRRRPTFRFDHGDVLWARASVSFQRAALQLLLAYSWTEIDKLLPALARPPNHDPSIVLKLDDRARVDQARKLILAGLDLADAARRAYLAENDDEREWLPNPRQKSHPLPLPVDTALYETWEQILGDLRRILDGEEGLSVSELAQLGGHRWESPPGGYIDLGAMLLQPKDIVIDPSAIQREAERNPERALSEALGDYYRPSMKPSPLLRRIARMKREIDLGQESLNRKVRYLFWLN